MPRTNEPSPPERFQASITQAGTTVRATVIGELDIAGAPQLAALLNRKRMVPPVGLLVLDLTGVTFIDSSGVQVLVETRNKLDGSLRVIPSSACVRMLELVDLADIPAR